MRYKAIIFDNVGVLLCEQHHRWSAEIARRFKLPPAQVYQCYSRQKAWQLFKKGKISESEFWRRGNQKMGLNLNINLLKKLARKTRKPDIKMTSLLYRLKNKYILGLLNNEGREWDDYSKKKEAFYSLFDFHIASYHHGLAKPEKGIYRRLLARLKVLKIKPKEVIYIDDYKNNLKPAREKGIKAILFRNHQDLKRRLSTLKVL